MADEAPHQVIRVRFSKLGKVRFTSHRDVARMWERALRRSSLHVAWSQGFSPRPLLSFGLALPTGCESLAEYLDVRLEAGGEEVGAAALPEPLSTLLPDGAERAGSRAGALSRGVASAGGNILHLDVGGARGDRTGADGACRVSARRTERSSPARAQGPARGRRPPPPSVLSLALAGDRPHGDRGGTSPLQIRAELATRPRGVRPAELVEGLGADLELARACRTHQWIERDGARWEPLPLRSAATGPAPPHAQERAS